MSYIRSGSNPEKLYIWGDGDKATIAEGSKETWNIPLDIFNGLIQKYHRRYHDYPCHHKGAQVEEVWVYDGDLEVDDEKINPILTHSERKVKLTYEDHYVIMYDVTWEYIVYSNLNKFKIRSSIISALSSDIQKVINKEICEDLRYEAMTVLLLTTDEYREEFLKYSREDKGNLCCLVVDKAKEELVKEKKLKQNKNDGFGWKK
jgi:hypothetical protein